MGCGVVESIGGFISDPFGKKQGQAAVNAQSQAAADANRVNKEIFDIQRADQQPWRQAGMSALTQLQTGMNDMNRGFSMNDFQKDPGYQFRMDEGLRAIDRSAAARGGLNSGATMKALTRFGQDFASNEYTNAYNRFKNDQNQRFNQLSSLAGVGQVANNQIGNAAANYGAQTSNNILGVGNAQAANYMSQANLGREISGTLYGAGAKFGMGALFSDISVKKNIGEISKEDIAELRKAIKPHIFNYVDESYGKGDWVGVMIQDIENTKIGKRIVETDSDGVKFIPLQKFFSLYLATLAEV